jgi:hypothetical protein
MLRAEFSLGASATTNHEHEKIKEWPESNPTQREIVPPR